MINPLVFALLHQNQDTEYVLSKMSHKQCSSNEKRKPKELHSVQKKGTESNNQRKASVFLRIRSRIEAPYVVEKNVFRILNPKSKNHSKNFTFTNILESESTQSEVYGMCVEQAIEAEENLTVLTYGASNSGKTFTLMGDEKHPGIIPRAVEQIFSRYSQNMASTPTLKLVRGEWTILDDDAVGTEFNNREHYFGKSKSTDISNNQKIVRSEHNFLNGSGDGTIAYVWISLVEIYNENVVDLLELPTMKKRKSLTIVANGGNAYISGLTSVFVTSTNEASHLFKMGTKARQNGSTKINSQSSRSHCIFIVNIILQNQSKVTQINYKFCDLAGSERLKKAETEGVRCQEANSINKSLLVLGRCLHSIHANQKLKSKEIVPFRDSKLTFFLQSSLTGNEQLSFIVHMLPTTEFHEENEQVLRFASMAQEIVYQKPVKEIVGRRSTFSNFLAQVNANIADSINYPHVQLILSENDRLKKKISMIETEFVERDEVEQKDQEIEHLKATILQLSQERDDFYQEQFETNDKDPIYACSPDVYKVDEIVNDRIRNGKKQYLVKWSPSWVSKKDVTKDLIEEFILKKAGPNSGADLHNLNRV